MNNFLDPLDFDIYRTLVIRKREYYQSTLASNFQQGFQILPGQSAFLSLKIRFSNQQIVQGILTGDEDVYSYIRSVCYPVIENWISRNKGRIEDVEDVFQEAQMKAYEMIKKGNFVLTKSIKGYIIKTAANVWCTQNTKKINCTNIDEIYDLNDDDDVDWQTEPSRKDGNKNISVYSDEYPNNYDIINTCIDNLPNRCKSLIESLKNDDWKEYAASGKYSNANSAKTQKSKCLSELKKEVELWISRAKKDPSSTKYLTAKQAGMYLKITGQKFNDLRNSGKIEFQIVGGKSRSTIESLNMYLSNNITYYAWCNESYVWLDIKKQKMISFEYGNLYRIVNENPRWIYLFSSKWGNIGQFSKKEFKKYFSIAEDHQIRAAKYDVGSKIL